MKGNRINNMAGKHLTNIKVQLYEKAAGNRTPLWLQK